MITIWITKRRSIFKLPNSTLASCYKRAMNSSHISSYADVSSAYKLAACTSTYHSHRSLNRLKTHTVDLECLTSGQDLCEPQLFDHLLFALLMPVYWPCCLAAAMPLMLTNPYASAAFFTFGLTFLSLVNGRLASAINALLSMQRMRVLAECSSIYCSSSSKSGTTR